MTKPLHSIAIFASGSGSNAENIIKYFRDKNAPLSFTIYCNNPQAGVLQRASRLGVGSFVFDRAMMKNGQLLDELLRRDTKFIVLAGFLWLVPATWVQHFPNRIVNIHPSLLPKFGGKNMYGMNVHEAVIGAGETVSGITIHLVNEKYDEGEVIFQDRCLVDKGDTPESLAHKIHALEHAHFPRVVEGLLKNHAIL